MDTILEVGDLLEWHHSSPGVIWKITSLSRGKDKYTMDLKKVAGYEENERIRTVLGYNLKFENVNTLIKKK
jgi:hypothetical protein